MDELYPVAAERSVPSRLFTWKKAILGGAGAFAVLIGVGVGWVMFGDGMGSTAVEAPTSVEQSVAVIPFVNMSGDPDNEYFSDGITEELLNALAQLPGVRVPGRTSSFAFKGQNLTIPQIADTLNVTHVLEGSVRRDGERVLITAQLVDAQSDTRLWSDTFERELEDIFEIQRQIASAIADQLQIALSGDQRAQLVAEATESTGAHEAYLRGRSLWNQRSEASLRSAITKFQQAVDLDPSYAEAHSGLADSYQLVDVYTGEPENRDFPTHLDQGLIAAQTAVRLAPNLGMARTSLAHALWAVGEWDRAEEEFQRAISLSPGYATAHQWYGLHLHSLGRANEAVGHGRMSRGVDPISRIAAVELYGTFIAAGRTEEAIEEAREATRLAPDWPDGWFNLADALARSGESEAAMDAWLQAQRLALVEDLRGAETAFRAVISYRQTGELQTVPEYDADRNTLVFLGINAGQPESAIELIESFVGPGAYGRAAQNHVRSRLGDLVGDDPRYQPLLEEAGITW